MVSTADSVAKRSTTALLWSVGGAIGKISGQLVVQITLARILGPEAFGQFAVLLAVLSLGGTLADCGFGAALIQKKEIDDTDISLALGWTLTIALILAALICIAAPWLADQFGDASLFWMFTASAALIIPQALGNLSTNLLHRELKMKGIQVIHVVSYVFCFGGVAVTLALLGWGGWSLIVAYAAQTLFKLIATYSICRHTLRPRLHGDTALIRFGLKSMANDLSNWAMDNMDRFLIGKVWGIYSLGLYSVAFNLAKAPSALMVFAAQNIAFSSAARLQNDVAALRKGFQVVIAAVSLASIPLFAMVSMESSAVLHTVYGAKWIEATPYMTALALTIPLFALGSITAALLRGTGAIGTELRVQTATAVVFFGGLLLLKGWPLSSAIWIVPTAYLVRFTILLAAIHRRLNLSIRELVAPFRGGLVLAVVGLAAIATINAMNLPLLRSIEIAPLLLGCLACTGVFCTGFDWFLSPSLATVLRNRLFDSPLALVMAWFDRRTT